MKYFDAQKEAAASDKSSIEMATEIIGDLRQHNYGIAERNTAILIARLEHEEQERCETKASSTEIKPDAFEQTIQTYIKNLEPIRSARDEYFAGMISAYRYALALYKEMV